MVLNTDVAYTTMTRETTEAVGRSLGRRFSLDLSRNAGAGQARQLRLRPEKRVRRPRRETGTILSPPNRLARQFE